MLRWEGGSRSPAITATFLLGTCPQIVSGAGEPWGVTPLGCLLHGEFGAWLGTALPGAVLSPELGTAMPLPLHCSTHH